MANEIKVEINKVKNINVSIQKIEGIGGGTTNLTYTASPTNGTVNSDTGTDAIIPLADVTNAGLIAPAEKAKLTNTSGTNTGDNAPNSQYSPLITDKANLSGATFTGKVTVENEIEINNAAIVGPNNGIIQKVDNVGGKGVFSWLFNNTSGFPLIMSAVRNVANTLDFIQFFGRVKIQDATNNDEAVSLGQSNTALATKQNTLGITDMFFSPFLSAGSARIRAIANTGYLSTFTNRQLIAPLLNYILNTGLAANTLFHHDARLGFNSNFVFFSDDINDANTGWDKGSNLTANGQVGVSPLSGAKAWSFSFVGGGSAFIQGDSSTGRFAILPNTTYTVSADVRLASGVFAGGSRSIYLRCQDSAGVFTTNRGGAALVPTSTWQRFSITVTTGASDAFASFLFPFDCDSGSTLYYAAPQIEIGSTATTYQARLNNTALLLNNLVDNALGDGTMANGVSSTMTVIDATAGRVLNYNNALSQGVSTSLIAYVPNLTFIVWTKSTNLSANRVVFGKTITDGRLIINTNGAIRLTSSSSLVTGASEVVAGAWVCIAYTSTGAGATVIYKNGASVLSGTLPRAVNDIESYQLGETADGPFLGQIGEATFFNTILTDSQILDIYNIQKSRYGL